MVFNKMSRMGDWLLFFNFSRIEINQEVVKTSLKTSVQTCDANRSTHGRGEQLRKTKCSTVECFRPVALAAGRSRADAMCISGILLATIDKVGKTCGQICALSLSLAPALTYSAVLVALDCQLLISPRDRERVCVVRRERIQYTNTHVPGI